MFDKIGRGVLVSLLTAAVLCGAYLGYGRYFMELQNRTVELCVDLNDVKKMAAFEKVPLEKVLNEIKNRGFISTGVFEETLPDANALGEIYYAKGSGFMWFYDQGSIKTDRTYIYAPSDKIRKRIADQLKWVLGEKNVHFIGSKIIEVNEAEEEIRSLGLGISEVQSRFLNRMGFRIIPRLWNDPRYNQKNMKLKIGALRDFDTVIFDGDEILGSPDAIGSLASALLDQKIKYGYIEIVKQEGDGRLRKLMGQEVVRVHSVPMKELKKIKSEEAVNRFVRAARERNVRLIYVRPFLPPQIESCPISYNLDYFSRIKSSLEKAGFVLGKAESISLFRVKGWQVLVLGMGAVVGTLFLLNYFINLPLILEFLLLFLSSLAIIFIGSAGYGTILQKSLALLAAIVFPALAVISSFAKAPSRRAASLTWDLIFIILNVVAETMVGVFLLIGLLADYRFMLGVETFAGVKFALILPVLIVALYFILQRGEGSLKNRLSSFFNTSVNMLSIVIGLIILGALGVFLARSGNFVLPVPVFEKYFRNFLEAVFFIRPRTKEFLAGYPFLFLAAISLLRGKKKWVWLMAALGTIAPVSILNSFSHIHSPLMVTVIRTINGLGLGIMVGLVVAFMADRFLIKE